MHGFVRHRSQSKLNVVMPPNIKNHQNLNKAIALGHSERKCCNKRSNALIVSAMVVATTAGLVGSDDGSHALVALGGSKLLAESWQGAREPFEISFLV
jgi:hypothetical protein